jgi:RNA recognition motif-containing protein
VVFDNEDALEKVMKDKQETELDGEKIFLDYTDEKSKHGGKGKDKDFGNNRFHDYSYQNLVYIENTCNYTILLIN